MSTEIGKTKNEIENNVKSERDHIGEYEESDKCPECGGIKLIRDYERAELVCEKCGLVIDGDFIDTGPDWRAFDSEERNKKMRVGAPMDIMTHDKGLSTNIGTGTRDSNGNSISSNKKTKFYRLRKWHRQSKFSDSKERDLALALGELNRMASQLNIPKSVSEDASMIYRKIAEKGLVKGRSIEAMVGSVLYISCRQNKIPRTLDEISESARVSRKEIGRAYRYIASELGIMLEPAKPEEYVPRFCSQLGLTNKVQFRAEEILKQASEKELTSGRDPTSIAAAGIYIASVQCGEKRSQKKVANAASTTEVTVRNRYQELCEELDIEMDVN
ncbi:transcription initiation factor IIB family protein [Methanonatronarchaeum sp. AMET6-2]|uniref:transcription initiation factor IIB n=1 Tax=Methanonatronarchaeum sp. AMET6-2 TaxID=2933293 RepID=UPI001201C40E|nr:transcription initiation factor IIB [Methanonatronarchaeum sp. AMET6-2]RZN63045.1 MAG: transcription initiation factor IIB [Methanonatronarchaeia archaeon]UOY10260.1 transcription initiation factor IIB [Methanonatronarchaeum sp. AMET6-2]